MSKKNGAAKHRQYAGDARPAPAGLCQSGSDIKEDGLICWLDCIGRCCTWRRLTLCMQKTPLGLCEKLSYTRVKKSQREDFRNENVEYCHEFVTALHSDSRSPGYSGDKSSHQALHMKSINGFTARVALYLPQWLYDKLGAWAHTKDRSLANPIYGLLKRAALKEKPPSRATHLKRTR